jgi:hypothetical protein
MPFKEHPRFQPPASQNATIWRYMDLAKFLSLLQTGALFFVRVDKLADDDPFEGYYNSADIQIEKLAFGDTPEEWRKRNSIPDEQTFNVAIRNQNWIRELVKAERETTFVNSWHAQQYESAAMWRLYVRSQEGIAIQTTYERLVQSFEQYEDFEIHVGMVNYIDYKTESIPFGNVLSPFMFKRKSFEHERELRALIWTSEHGKNVSSPRTLNKYRDQSGLRVTSRSRHLSE